MSRTTILRAGVVCGALFLSLTVVMAGCGPSSQSPSTGLAPAGVTASEKASSHAPSQPSSTAVAASDPVTTSSAYPALASGQTYEAVVLGPATEPLAPEDIAPRLFSDEPTVREVLETAVPASMAAKSGPYVYRGVHLVVGLDVGGAAETATGVEVYAEACMRWFALAGWQPIDDVDGSYALRIRLKKDGGAFVLEGVDKPKDGEGYTASLQEMLPPWVRDRVTRQASWDEMRAALTTAVAEWARPHVPADLFVEQSPLTHRDPHEHQPALSMFRMLAPAYVDCRLSQIPRPAKDDYQPEFSITSEDGRFGLFMLPNARAVEDKLTGEWWSLVTPGHAIGSMFSEPAWSGHTLFIDFTTCTIDPLRPTLTHYEIDFDTMTVVRAVPMGPLSFNGPIR